MKLFIVRHGQTEMNVKGLIQSHSDSTLNNVGLQQAGKIAQRLMQEMLQFAYSSDLLRAKHTAEEILKFHPHINLNINIELREKHAGILEGMAKKDTVQKFDKTKHTFQGFKPEGGESFEEAQIRVAKFYNELLDTHKGQNVLIVAHGGIIGALLLHILNKPLVWEEYDIHRPANAALTVLEIKDTEDHEVHLLNCTLHLE